MRVLFLFLLLPILGQAQVISFDDLMDTSFVSETQAQYNHADTVFTHNYHSRLGNSQLIIKTSKREPTITYTVYLVRGRDTLYQFAQVGYIKELIVTKQKLVLKVVSPPCCCSKTKEITALFYFLDQGKFGVERASIHQDILQLMPTVYVADKDWRKPLKTVVYKAPYISSKTWLDECTGEEKHGNQIGIFQSAPVENILSIGDWNLVMLQTKSKLLNYGMESSWVVGWMQDRP